jgi:hypothetical protein
MQALDRVGIEVVLAASHARCHILAATLVGALLQHRGGLGQRPAGELVSVCVEIQG